MAGPPAGAVTFDYDGDGKADLASWTSSTNVFKVRKSSNGSIVTATLSAGIPAPADYDNDGKTDCAVFTGGTWSFQLSSAGGTSTGSITAFGQSGDYPVPGDWTGDGYTDAAVYRPSNGTWYYRDALSPNTVTSVQFGTTGDIPVAGNFDGDSKMDQAVFRPSTGYWYINGSTSGFQAFAWGINGDVPFGMDFDGDGKSDPGVYRPSTGYWYVLKSSTGYSTYFAQGWGSYGDQPVPADIDGDGKADFSVWRPTTGVWHTLINGSSTYEHHTLGVPGDFAATSAYIKQIGAPVGGSATAGPRLDPKNAVGGTNLYSRNFSWSSTLANLPGRSGLNASVGISYNSLVWLKADANVIFDPDISNVTPGFHLGMPTLEPAYYDAQKDAWAYMMITTSGGREEFVQAGAGNVYQTTDSTYSRLITKGADSPNDPVEDITIEVSASDGTVMSYAWLAGAFRCSKVRDRNGNYILFTNSDEGLLTKVTDTLGREINIGYDDEFYPTSITQTWKDSNGSGSTTTHTYATFNYTSKTVDTSWDSGLTVYGPPDDAVVKVLDKITYSDGSATAFDYNGYLQVKKVRNIAADSSSHVLNYVSTDLDSVSGTQDDCPRFGATRSWAENFNGGSEVVVTNSVTPGQTYSLPGSLAGSATRIDVAMTGHPDGLYTRTYVGASGWQEGLQLATEDCTGTGCADRKRWTYTAWTQDNTGVAYPLNPRVTETRVGDSSNVKRTTIDYYEPSTGVFPYGLPETVRVYDSDLSTVLKTQVTSYNLSSIYTDRNIIGLPAESDLFEGTTSGTLMSKTTWDYDYDDDFAVTGMGQNDTGAVNHDDANFGATFSAGRGNLTSVTRWDAEHPTNSSYAAVSQTLYNITGSPVAQITPWDGTNTRTVRIGYADSWNDGVTRTTYAYPTVLTDPSGTSLGAAGHTSTIKYRFDLGTNVEAVSPAPAGQTYGKTSQRSFDSVGRVESESILVNTTLKSYVRYEYPTNGVEAKSFATLVDTGTNGPDSSDEVMSESWMDGAGRTLAARTEHPGSTGGWSAVVSSYDVLGRLHARSVPTEVSVSGTTWTPAGDDATRGWVWTTHEFDWKGRETRIVASDGTDTLAEYDGCGCAGDDVVTLYGEELSEGRRRQKIYHDVLGRESKIEMLDWNGSVYKTVTNVFDGRDQIIQSKVFAGDETSSSFHVDSATFDGFGRLETKHDSQQDTSANTVYSYLPDGDLASVTDGRGASKHYTYNVLGLIDQIAWTVPVNSDIPVPASVTFDYDNLGNRIEMTDGNGTVTYERNSLSQIQSETREFNETVSQSPTHDNKFRIEYTYGQAGQLASYKEPFGEVVSYGYQKSGRLDSVSGNRTVENEQVNYIDQIGYRAWSAPKAVSFHGGINMSISYNDKLQPSEYEMGDIRLAYQYYPDGKLKFSSLKDRYTGSWQDEPDFDRSFEYDFLGRMTSAKTGVEASGQTENDPTQRPYRISNTYNAFGDLTAVTRSHYRLDMSASFSFNANGRISSDTHYKDLQSWFSSAETIVHAYDADGRQTENTEEYDANGRKTMYNIGPTQNSNYRHWFEAEYDGDGRVIKTNERVGGGASTGCYPASCDDRIYRIVSTVLDQPVAELRYDGRDFVHGVKVSREVSIYGGGKKIATRTTSNIGTQYEGSDWELEATDPSGLEFAGFANNGGVFRMIERLPIDPFGAGIGEENPYPPPEEAPDPQDPPNCDILDHDHQCEGEIEWDDTDSESAEAGSPQGNTCYIEGFEQQNCDQVARYIAIADDTPVSETHGLDTDTSARIGSLNNDDPTDDRSAPGDAGEQAFQADSTGNVNDPAVMRGSLVVNAGADYSPVSDLDLGMSTAPDPAPTPPDTTECEKTIANAFGDAGSYFSNPHDGDGIDLTTGMDSRGNRLAPLGSGDYHLYGSATDPDARSNLYIPPGGSAVAVGRGKGNYLQHVTNGDSYVAIQFVDLNATMFVYHPINVKMETINGRTKIGEMGAGGGGEWNFWERDKTKVPQTALRPSFHYHFEWLDGLHKTLPTKKRFLLYDSLCGYLKGK